MQVSEPNKFGMKKESYGERLILEKVIEEKQDQMNLKNDGIQNLLKE